MSNKEGDNKVDGNSEVDFGKIVRDFVKDILLTFPELETVLDVNLTSIAKEENNPDCISAVRTSCEQVYPERFFDILYKNDKIFEQDEPLLLLPGIDFRKLWKDNISDATRETMWKYLQLILFSVVSNLSDSSSFGDTAKLFEAIDQDKFRSKLEETIEQMQGCFDESGTTGTTDTTGINPDNLPDPEILHEHVSGMMDGKLGSLAREIAEETANDLNVDMEDETSVGDVFQKLLQEPTKLMGLVQKVGGKLDEKIKTGELKESELIAEAGNIMEKMKDMPGLANIQSMFGGGGGGKINVNAMQAHLDRTMKLAKQRERMKDKATGKKSTFDERTMTASEMEDAEAAANEAVKSLLRSEGVSDEGIEKLVFTTGEAYQKSSPLDAPLVDGETNIVTADIKRKKKKKKKKKNGK